MSAPPAPLFQRDSAAVLAARLGEPRRFLQVVADPRQVGKTTLVQQVLAELARPTVPLGRRHPHPRAAARGAARLGAAAHAAWVV